jgi:phosphatidylserine decarboxylase
MTSAIRAGDRNSISNRQRNPRWEKCSYASRGAMESIQILDRGSGRMVPEPVLGAGGMRWAYHRRPGRLIRWFGMRTGLASRILGAYCNASWSRGRIRPFVEALGIDLDEVDGAIEDFPTFNAFFARRLRAEARPPAPDGFLSPADARLTVIPSLDDGRAVPVKGTCFTVDGLLRDHSGRSGRFHGGAALVFRLCPADYHRYHHPAAGRVVDAWEISGRYDSVHPHALASGLPIFVENRRSVSLLELEDFGCVAFVAVGAFGVGGIVQTHRGERFDRFSEKGYFEYGGSTLVLLVEPGALHLDQDLVTASAQGLEVLVRAGEHIGDSR